jgi:hypothetical protein
MRATLASVFQSERLGCMVLQILHEVLYFTPFIIPIIVYKRVSTERESERERDGGNKHKRDGVIWF